MIDIDRFARQLVSANQLLTQNEPTDRVINCLKSSFASFEYYQTKQQQIASIVRSIVKNHCFVDGNKRTALVALTSLNEICNVRCKLTKDDIDDVLVDIASHKYTVDEVVRLLY